ncbi:DEAD/DEAH box helicase [Trichothermofontia sp.]
MSLAVPNAEFNLKALFPFELDDFQHDAIAALNARKSVVVCVPTGSGKTLIGEYAIHRALSRGKRVFYTTPLKALSNQKFRDFRNQFGVDRVGLLTGDVSINREAPILVMTTEIFRNMLYGTPIGEVGTSLLGVETVVLDECHYMNDAQRGTVWEESIIYCPRDIQLVALSATIANSQQLTAWLEQVHGPTELIYSDFRPVPLQVYFCNTQGMFPLLNEAKQAINPRLKPKRSAKDSRQANRANTPDIRTVLEQLQARQMLPAIYFIFSRRGCDQAVQAVGDLSLVTAEEAAQLQAQIDSFLQQNPEVGRAGQVEALYRGIAAHHAGILPAWKGFIEELFQQGLIKVVFATETLAAGINMPARTTVISSLSKRTDHGHRLLNASEFLQMAGRAGRRGMDEVGYVVTVQTAFEGAKEAAYLATAGADALKSQFTPSYGMVLNLLQTHSLTEAQDLVERSFGRYLVNEDFQPQKQAINDLTHELEQLQAQLADVDWDLLADYEKLRGKQKEAKRLLKILQLQAEEARTRNLADALAFAVTGTILSLNLRVIGKHQTPALIALNCLPAVLVTKLAGSGRSPYLVCLGADNRWYVVAIAEVLGLHGELPRLQAVDHLTLPPAMTLKPGYSHAGDSETQAISQQVQVAIARLGPHRSFQETVAEFKAQQDEVDILTAQIEAHPVRRWQNIGTLTRRRQRLLKLQAEIRDRQAKLECQLNRYWEEFLSLIAVLQTFGCLADNKPTSLGESASAIRGDNELWLCLALFSGQLDNLKPHHFAAVCAALVTEYSRPDSWVAYELSNEVEEVLANLWPLRKQVIRVQERHGVAIPVLPYKWSDIGVAAIVEQWTWAGDTAAIGYGDQRRDDETKVTSWAEFCAQTSLDEGDIVRILRRTLDFLSQIPHVPNVPEALRIRAYQAMQQMDRFPVSEAID